jgi:hypothetical protein
MKGPAFPSAARPRLPQHIRTRIRAGDGLLNNIHSPDEPADLVRELGVLLNREDVRAIASAFRSARRGPSIVEPFARHLYERTPQHDLDVDEVIARIEAAAASRSDSSPRTVEILASCKRARARLPLDWRSVIEAIRAERLGIGEWDLIVFAAGCTVSDVTGVEPFLEFPKLPSLLDG